jgi:hypothetical protein
MQLPCSGLMPWRMVCELITGLAMGSEWRSENRMKTQEQGAIEQRETTRWTMFVCFCMSSVSVPRTSPLGGHACVSGDLSSHGCSSRPAGGYPRGRPSRNPYQWTRYRPSARVKPARNLQGPRLARHSSLVQLRRVCYWSGMVPDKQEGEGGYCSK